MRFIYLILTITVFLLNCNSKDCFFDDSFLTENAKEKPMLLIKPATSACETFLLEGRMEYRYIDFKINKNLVFKDSTYFNSSGDIVFDFRSNKSPGILKVNDSLSLKMEFLMDINDESETFRLFKIKEVDNFEGLNLDLVLVTNLKYGIVGQFITGYENEKWHYTRYLGYMPNEEYFKSVFKYAELL